MKYNNFQDWWEAVLESLKKWKRYDGIPDVDEGEAEFAKTKRMTPGKYANKVIYDRDVQAMHNADADFNKEGDPFEEEDDL